MNNTLLNEIELNWDYFFNKVGLQHCLTYEIIQDLHKRNVQMSKPESIYDALISIRANDWFENKQHSVARIFYSDKISYLNSLEERISFIYKITYAQMYEEFERFWKSSLKSYLCHTKKEFNDNNYFIDKKNKEIRGNAKSFISGLKLIDNDKFETFNKNNDVKQIFDSLSFARHKIIHNNGVFKISEIENEYFDLYFKIVSVDNDKFCINMDFNFYSKSRQALIDLTYFYYSFLKNLKE